MIWVKALNHSRDAWKDTYTGVNWRKKLHIYFSGGARKDELLRSVEIYHVAKKLVKVSLLKSAEIYFPN